MALKYSISLEKRYAELPSIVGKPDYLEDLYLPSNMWKQVASLTLKRVYIALKSDN